MKRFGHLTLAGAIVGALIVLSACDGEFASDPSRPRPTRAVAVPVERNSALGEMNSGKEVGTPILSVDLANTKADKPQVHTIVDPLVKPPATQPPAAPAATRPVPSIHTGSGGDPINGPGE